MAVLKTAFLFAFTGLNMLIFIPVGCLAFLLSFLGLRKPMAWLVYHIARNWARAMIWFIRCPVTVKGRENIPSRGGVCFVSNHGSIFDILLALAYIGRPFGFIAKKELALVPFLNMWIYILGGLFLDRKHPRKALNTIHGGVRRIKAGSGVLIFPEGHRSRGQGLLPFRSGAFKLATLSGAPVVPLAIAGSYEVFEKTGKVAPAPVTVTFCRAIRPEDLPQEDRKQALPDMARERIAEALQAQAEEGPGSARAEPEPHKPQADKVPQIVPGSTVPSP